MFHGFTSDFLFSQWLFFRFLGLVYLLAFSSLLVQIKGLYSSKGILPAGEYLERVRRRYGIRRFFRCPTLFWINSSDHALIGAGIIGIVFSLLLVTDHLTSVSLLVLWMCYLSFVSIGQDFLMFQWDALLLEIGFLGFLISLDTPSSSFSLLLLWFVNFRFMFSSGIRKLLSGDRTWRNLSALKYHYETQPLPTPLAWYVHKMPVAFHRICTFLVLFIEIVVPFLIFGSNTMRVVAALILAFLQVAIVLTGNYGFFNILSIVILIPLVPDGIWFRLTDSVNTFHSAIHSRAIQHIIHFVTGVLFVLNLLQFIAIFLKSKGVLRLLSIFSPFFLVNSYGLFTVMTTLRYEVNIEGSDDGVNWREYEFKWKPVKENNPLKWNIPHQPRLDWQMWFLALRQHGIDLWFVNLLLRLLEGEGSVLSLLKTNPFPENPPRYIRAVLYEYRFTSTEKRRKTGCWWERKPLGLFCPVINLK